ncbi:hypothetical protein ACLOJK_016479 [Asimina triloba]
MSMRLQILALCDFFISNRSLSLRTGQPLWFPCAYHGYPETWLLSICNGLIFYCRGSASLLTSKHDLYVCNPEAREHVLISKFTTEQKLAFDISGLAFHPAKTDSDIASYKLVIGALKPRLQFYIYSSDTRAWGPLSPRCYPESRRYSGLQSQHLRCLLLWSLALARRLEAIESCSLRKRVR